MQQNLSLVLVSDTTGEIIAGRITTISNKKDKFDKDQFRTEGFKKMIDLYCHLLSFCNVYDRYNVDEVVQFFGLGVHRDYRQRGIGYRVMKAALAMIQNLELGAVLVKGEGTSNYSKKIYEKNGFENLAEVIYDDYKEDGEVVFKTEPDQKSERLYAKVV